MPLGVQKFKNRKFFIFLKSKVSQMVSHFRMPLGHWTRETVPNFWDRFAPLFRVLGVSRSAVSLRVLVTPDFARYGRRLFLIPDLVNELLTKSQTAWNVMGNSRTVWLLVNNSLTKSGIRKSLLISCEFVT